MIEMTQSERNYILAGNYQMLDDYVASVRREMLLMEKKYDDMLERKNAEISQIKKDIDKDYCAKSSLGRKCRIRNGAIIHQDCSSRRWEDDGTIFEVEDFSSDNNIKKLTAFGYGKLIGITGSYGNGALYVNNDNLIDV